MIHPARLHIVTGKGGVGKTVVATALALCYAERGKKVLLAEFNGRDRVSALLGYPPVGSNLTELRPNLFVVDMNPRDAIREYALLSLKFEALYRLVFENQLVQRFLRLVPSLNELVMIGKLWHHEQEQVRGIPKFDCIVLDGPATGHALATLRAPKTVYETVPPGPMRSNAQLLEELLTDANRTVLHLVTTPEEMPVTEAIEIAQTARDELHIRLGALFVNQFVDCLPPAALKALEPLQHNEATALLYENLQRRETKCLQGNRHLSRLPDDLKARAVYLPRIPQADFSLQALTQLAATMAPFIA